MSLWFGVLKLSVRALRRGFARVQWTDVGLRAGLGLVTVLGFRI